MERPEGEGGSLAPLTGRRALQRPLARNQLAASRGRGSSEPRHAVPGPARGPLKRARAGPCGTGAPRPRRDCQPERTVPSAHPSASRRTTGGERPTTRRRQGSAAMSATHPTRLETRTKESNARASQRVSLEAPWRNESEGRRYAGRGGIPAPPPPRGKGRAHHRPVSPAPSGRWSRSARDRTRKMVNYAWAGRSQRKLWWRPAAVLTCKSVVRPGYRGERLIEPSSSWFLPKSPSGQQALGVPPVLSGKAND